MDTNSTDPNVTGSVVMGVWSFLGGVMRGGNDWKDPVTGKFSLTRLFVCIATALVLGQIGGAIGTAMHWEPYAVFATAGCLGYLGPAPAVAIFERFSGLGKKDAASVTIDPPPKP